MQLEITDLKRNPWNVELGKHARQIIGYSMTHEGRLLLRYLLIQGRIECSTPFMHEISMDTQNREMQTAVSNGLISRQQESGGLQRTFYVGNPQFWPVLQKVLPDILREQ